MGVFGKSESNFKLLIMSRYWKDSVKHNKSLPVPNLFPSHLFIMLCPSSYGAFAGITRFRCLFCFNRIWKGAVTQCLDYFRFNRTKKHYEVGALWQQVITNLHTLQTRNLVFLFWRKDVLHYWSRKHFSALNGTLSIAWHFTSIRLGI